MTSGRSSATACHQAAAVLDDAGEFEVLLENALQALGDDAVVIGEQHARLGGH